MFYVLIVHLEYYSIFSMFAWERFGLVSSAEGFVWLSGIVLGIVSRRRVTKLGLKKAMLKLWQRAFQLYRVNVFVILSISLLGMLPFINTYELTHWTAPGTADQSFPLYPPASTPWFGIIKQALLLSIGPHQFQVIGLYVVILALSPLFLCCLHYRHTLLLFIISGSIYISSQFYPMRLTEARFEYAFPLISWQLLFINGMVAGYYHHQILGYFTSKQGQWWVMIAGLCCLGFAFIAHNKPHPLFWPWQGFSYIDAETYRSLYHNWFNKNSLGLGRVLNDLFIFVLSYALLSRYWRCFNQYLGWLLIPIGQASLYVFLLHVYFILIISNTILPEINNFYLNSIIHASSLLIIWGLIKYKVLFNIIPR